MDTDEDLRKTDEDLLALIDPNVFRILYSATLKKHGGDSNAALSKVKVKYSRENQEPNFPRDELKRWILEARCQQAKQWLYDYYNLFSRAMLEQGKPIRPGFYMAVYRSRIVPRAEVERETLTKNSDKMQGIIDTALNEALSELHDKAEYDDLTTAPGEKFTKFSRDELLSEIHHVENQLREYYLHIRVHGDKPLYAGNAVGPLTETTRALQDYLSGLKREFERRDAVEKDRSSKEETNRPRRGKRGFGSRRSIQGLGPSPTESW